MKVTMTTADSHSFTCDVLHVSRWLGSNQWVKLSPDDIVLKVNGKKQSEDMLAFVWVKALKHTLWWRR